MLNIRKTKAIFCSLSKGGSGAIRFFAGGAGRLAAKTIVFASPAEERGKEVFLCPMKTNRFTEEELLEMGTISKPTGEPYSI